MNPYLISTDPPYYDKIGYSDLSDFFNVWLRRSRQPIDPDLLSTMLVPRSEELVANPYRHGGKDGAHKFFEDGFSEVFRRARESALPDFPITVYYAFKQQDADGGGEASSGWETLLEGMIRSGWTITATWPVRSESSGRMISIGTNALASSIVLALRPRPEGAPTTETNFHSHSASFSRAPSPRSTCHKPQSAQAWRCSPATAGFLRTTAKR